MIRLLTLLAAGFTSQVSQTLLKDSGFENGLQGWKVEGKVAIERSAPVAGKASLRIEEGPGAVRQQYKVPGLRILYFGAHLQPSGPDVEARLRLQCFDARGLLMLDRAAKPDAKKAAGIYLKTHAFTSYVVLSIEKGQAGTLLADDVQLQDEDRGRVEHKPLVDLDLYMKPIWDAKTVVNESALLLARRGVPPSGRLMFTPDRVLSVRNSALSDTYTEGRDFYIRGNQICASPGSSIPTIAEADFPKTPFPWADLTGKHVFVTYEHKDRWNGPVPSFQGDRLPETIAKLHQKKECRVVAYGDSITLGVNVSGFRNVAPYMPPWPNLFVRELGKSFGDSKIKLYNTSLGGMTSAWAKENAKDVVASLDPDLVIVAFGMNDFWSLTPEEFGKNIQETMAIVREARPKTEFVLVSSMKFDPAYTGDPTYLGHFNGYEEELRKMVGKGVALVDMTEMSEALYRAKSAKDLGADPMHPDDFLARWYAQAMVATLVRTP